jgi:LPXTG-motif cell wall-anchored protein
MRRLVLLAGLVSVFVCLFATAAAADVYPPVPPSPGPAPAPVREVPVSRGALPFTGSNVLTFVLIALVAVALGLVLIVAFRRRAKVLSKA